MIGSSQFSRRAILTATGGMALGAVAAADAAAANRPVRAAVSAAQFGAVGDGTTDDTAALQKALRSVTAEGGSMLVIPPGQYRVTEPLVIEAGANVTQHWGIRAHGARIVSAISGGGNVLHVVSRATARFLVIEGLEILGSGHDGHGLVLECDEKGAYLYNACLRDIVAERCGGDGCVMVGNVFESQIFNSYFRDNHGNGVTLAHGQHGGILSAIHVFGCVFGQNGQHGVALERGCYDVSFNGCYFLLNGQFGLGAGNGCTLLSGCGFENNHAASPGPEPGNGAIRLVGFGTLVGCGAYSIMKQTALIEALVGDQLVMVGCRGFGDGPAKAAGLGRFSGTGGGRATLIGCRGAVERVNGFDPVELGGGIGGMRLGSEWHSPTLAQLGEYRLWVDAQGRLRLKKGTPTSDADGTVVGA